MDVINFNLKEKINKHHKLLPNSLRALLVGPSGCGKTNLLINLLLQPGWLDWDQLIIVTPTSDQEIWDIVKEFGEDETFPVSFLTPDEAPDTIEDFEDSLVVFDDCMLDSQTAPKKLFSQGRHKNVDVLYLFQKYTEVPKLLRDNCNFIILFNGIDGDAIRQIHRVWCTGDMSLENFQKWFSQSTSEPYSFIVIDLTDRKTKFRQSFDKVLT